MKAVAVVFFSVVETPGERRPTPSQGPGESESALFLSKNISVLRSCAWYREGPDGKALLFGDGGQNKGAYPSFISSRSFIPRITGRSIPSRPIFFTTYRLLCPVCVCDLGNCRLCLLALPAVIHQCLKSLAF